MLISMSLLLLLFLLSGYNQAKAEHQRHHWVLFYDDGSFNCTKWSAQEYKKMASLFKGIKCNKSFIEVSPMTCVTYGDTPDGTEIIASLCPYFRDTYTVSIPTEQGSDSLCQHLNRQGRLCSQCNENYSLPLNSYSLKCKPSNECHAYHWVLFFLVETSPVTIMYIIFMFYNVKLTAGYANVYIIYSQIVSLQMNTLLMTQASQIYTNNTIAASTVLSLYRMWSFQMAHVVSNHLCVHSELSQLTTVALQYTSVFYALLLALLGYIVVEFHSLQYRFIILLSKPLSWCLHFRDRSVDAKTVSLNTLAGFYYIGFAKLASVSLFLLASTPVYNETGHIVDHVSFYDGSLIFMESHHLPYAVLAIAVLIFLVIIPVLLMVFYQFQIVQKCLQKCHLHRPGLIIFVDALQGCYRDRNDGGWDFRWFSSYSFIFRLAVFVLYATILSQEMLFVLQFSIQCILIVSMVAVLCLNPYKYKWYNKLDVFIIAYANFITSIVVYQIGLRNNTPDHRYPGIKLEAALLLIIAFPILGATAYVTKKVFGSRIVFFCHFIHRMYRERRASQSVMYSMNETSPTATIREEDDHRSLLRNISDGSLPDRMLQPSRYKEGSRDASPVYYGTVSHRNLS